LVGASPRLKVVPLLGFDPEGGRDQKDLVWVKKMREGRTSGEKYCEKSQRGILLLGGTKKIAKHTKHPSKQGEKGGAWGRAKGGGAQEGGKHTTAWTYFKK